MSKKQGPLNNIGVLIGLHNYVRYHCLSFQVFEVKLARHSVRELFGLEDDSGKWNFGIISRFFASNTKPCVIVLVTPISSSVAHHFASIFDRGYFQTDSNHSFAIPRQVRFVFETTDISSVSPLLLARCSIVCTCSIFCIPIYRPKNCDVFTNFPLSIIDVFTHHQ